jgi:hypothetical protein
MGSGHSSHAHRKAASTHHQATSHKKSHKKSRAEDQATKDLRWCKSLSRHQLARNKRCERIVAQDKKASTSDSRSARELRRCEGLSDRRRSKDKVCRKLHASEGNKHRADHGSCKSLGYEELVHSEACRKLLDRDAKAAVGKKRKSSSSDRHRSHHRHR